MNRKKHDGSLNSESQLILSPLPLRCQGKMLIAKGGVGAQPLATAQSAFVISTGQSHHSETRTAALPSETVTPIWLVSSQPARLANSDTIRSGGNK